MYKIINNYHIINYLKIDIMIIMDDLVTKSRKSI